MKRIILSNPNHNWVCTQTFHQSKGNGFVATIKEFYKFDGDTPVDRIFVSYNKDLAIGNESIIRCLDEVLDNFLECTFIDNCGHTHTIISDYEWKTSEYGEERSMLFGKKYFLLQKHL